MFTIMNKNKVLCMKIIKGISAIDKKPIKTEMNNTSFKIVYSYAGGRLQN